MANSHGYPKGVGDQVPPVSPGSQRSMKIYESGAAYDAEELENAESGCPTIGLAIVFGEEVSCEERYGITLSFADLGLPKEQRETISTMEMEERAKKLDLEEFKSQADRLPCKDMFPTFDPEHHTEFEKDLVKGEVNTFCKKVSLLARCSEDRINVPNTKARVLAELRTCEILRQNPHPNLATYLGCRVENGFVTGMYYERYVDLEDIKPIPVEEFVEDMREGIGHLHSLGFCHNDINPYNVMVKHDMSAVIIDFDACLPTGEKMLKWPPWGFDREAKVSEEENDWFGLERTELWMHEWNKREKQESERVP